MKAAASVAFILALIIFLSGCFGLPSPTITPTPMPAASQTPLASPVPTAAPTAAPTPSPTPTPSSPACPANLSGVLTYPIMRLDELAGLTPLGNLNPPQHTFPVDHIYFASYPKNGSDQRVAVYAPGEITITGITEISARDDSGNLLKRTYATDYVVCPGVVIAVAGYNSLVPGLLNSLVNTNASCKEAFKHNTYETQCSYAVKYLMRAGEQIGWVRNEDFDDNIEIWAMDHNAEPRADVDFGWYGSPTFAWAFCFFDLYNGSLKEGYDAKFSRYDKHTDTFIPRTVEPVCGQIVQDVPGTVQGDWFYGPKENGQDYTNNLALVHDNLDPGIAVVSVGGIVSKDGKMMFFPRHAGFINREFSEIMADGGTYCFQDEDRLSGGYLIPGKFIARLMDDHTLQIEHQDGDCSGTEEFLNPFTYHR